MMYLRTITGNFIGNYIGAPPCNSLGLHFLLWVLCLIHRHHLSSPSLLYSSLLAVFISCPCDLLTFALFLNISLVSFSVLRIVVVMLSLFLNPLDIILSLQTLCSCVQFPFFPTWFLLLHQQPSTSAPLLSLSKLSG